MAEHTCSHTYEGPERRKGVDDRRADCPYHFGHEVAILNMEKKQTTLCHNLETVKLDVDNKTPQKLFYATAGGIIFLVISILVFQWTIFERVVGIGLSHSEAMGDIKVEVQKMNSAIDNDRYVNQLKATQLENAFKTHLNSAEKEYIEIRQTIKEVAKTLKEHSYYNNGGSK